MLRAAAVRSADCLLTEALAACCASAAASTSYASGAAVAPLPSSQRAYAKGRLRQPAQQSRDKRDAQLRRRDVLRALGEDAAGSKWRYGAVLGPQQGGGSGVDAAAAGGDDASSSSSSPSLLSWMPDMFKSFRRGRRQQQQAAQDDVLALPDPDDPEHAKAAAAATRAARSADAPTAAAAPAAGSDAAAGESSSSSSSSWGDSLPWRKKDGDKQKGPKSRWDEIAEHRDIGFSKYAESVRRNVAGAIEPRPATPSRQRIDAERLEFLRTRQHLRIAETLTDDERAVLDADPEAALRDETLLAAVAARARYGEAEVRDMIHGYARLRGKINAVADARARGGAMPAADDAESWEAHYAQWLAARDAADARAALARREPGACELRTWAPALGSYQARRRLKCRRTGLRYGDCCGALKKKESAAAA